MTNNWSDYGNNRTGSAHVKNNKERKNPFMKPIREFTITCDGDVYPCCNFFSASDIAKRHHIGNILNETIYELYTSNIFTYFRSKLLIFSEKFLPCSSCSDIDDSVKLIQDARQKILKKQKTDNE